MGVLIQTEVCQILQYTSLCFYLVLYNFQNVPFSQALMSSVTFAVRYHLDEDPKTLKVFTIPLHDSKGSACLYNHMGISPDGKILAVTSGSTLQWLCAETGAVLDTAEKAHEGVYFSYFLG
jgi:hypothetical protein